MTDLQLTVDALNKRRFIAKAFETMNEAKQEILELIRTSESVSTGSSETLLDCGILNELQSRGNTMISHLLTPPKETEDRLVIRRQELLADWYLTSTNAVTTGGDIVNIDGTGNRIAAMVFGPPKTIVLAGKNKIVPESVDPVERIKRDACGKNARRVGFKLPCAYDDTCHDCNNAMRMCRATMTITHPPFGKEAFYVFLVNENWGY